VRGQLFGQRPQRRLVADFPSRVHDVVAAARVDGQPMVVFIHLQEERAIGRAPVELQAEQLAGEALPGGDVARPDAEIAQLGDVGLMHEDLLAGRGWAASQRMGHHGCGRWSCVSRPPSRSIRIDRW
jgi:hypothetical protein